MSCHDDTRQRLLEAAGEKFAEKGYEATNVREITEAIGSSPAAVNYHFRSKEDLYYAAVRHAAQSCERLTPLDSWSTDLPPEQQLLEYVRAFMTRLLRTDVPDWHRTLIMRELTQPRSGSCGQLVGEFIRPSFESLQRILRQLLPTSIDPLQLHLIGGSIVGQCLHYHHARHVIPLLVGSTELRDNPIDHLSQHIWRFSLAAIRQLYPTTPESSS
jgi:AcrR family transcriptional regulator